ncbi:MAG: tRNA uridine-5-carboxymethylaminomethyl(34) synthesis GTPase MnmE [Nitrospirota bacterium]|nr:tRNA uridine-5-carboxymethylaminomethyl(34) synthesis GTPase MnmE [Nitrospirota bacterium]
MAGTLQDTIYAIATPVGEGGIGILRLSGEKAVEVANRIVRLRSGRTLASARSHHLYHADVLDAAAEPEGEAASAHLPPRPIDEVLAVVMRAPRSYTAEDVVEIHCHGGPYVLQALCESLRRGGARLAEPGEFTKRAFLNGRLDLAQAEAVLDTIQAKTAGSLRLAQEQLRGILSQEVNRLRDHLVQLLARVEAGIDFTEDDITFIQPQELTNRLREAGAAIGRLADTGREGRIVREGVPVAIVGRPNVGKSSLLNALLQTDRAIVTPIPGTTRDVLEEVLNIRGLPARILDTAGVRQTEDPVEQEGVRRSRAAMEQAELLLILVDGSVLLNEEDRALLALHPDKKRLLVINKSDLPGLVPDEALPVWAKASSSGIGKVVRISALTGAGLDNLRDAIRTSVLRDDFESGDSAVVTRLRHQTSLEKAREALTHAADSSERMLSGEFVAMDVRAGIDALGEITGAVTTEDILERIFRDFCIGK